MPLFQISASYAYYLMEAFWERGLTFVFLKIAGQNVQERILCSMLVY
jgi:hypothetical protein